MELINNTTLQAGFTLAFEPDGRELLVVAVKGTFAMPTEQGESAPLMDEQAPLAEADEFIGEPGYSATLYETDYAPRKPRCDVLLNGSAYAPRGRATTGVTVSLQAGMLTKAFNVVGNRVWRAGMLGCLPSDPEPFAVMPISYGNAFGGVDKPKEDPATHRWHPFNHAGVGYHEDVSAKNLDGKPLPNTEEIERVFSSSQGKYKPMAFGPIGRAWLPRQPLAGTYDQAWLEHRAPFWPMDFDWRYFQAAPPDQQIDYLVGGEQVILRNLTSEGQRRFTVPQLSIPVLLVHHAGRDVIAAPVADTLIIEPDEGRFMITWRVSHPLRKSIFELKEVIVGSNRRAIEPIWQKPHYASLDEYIRSRGTARKRAM